MTVGRRLGLLARHPRALLGSRGYILVLGHMRSYSSLLSHILGSHPEIAGYAEMHLSYRGPVDLLRLRAAVLRSLEGELPGRFVLDKVLHDEYRVSPHVASRRDVHTIFLVRRPAASIGSVIRMGSRISGEWYSDPAAATDYYATRVETLGELSRRLTSPYLFVRAESLVEEPARVLVELAGFLGLERPLDGPYYSLFPHTGEPGWGDDSSAIRAGRILPPEAPAEPPALDEGLLAHATRAYEAACRALERRDASAAPA